MGIISGFALAHTFSCTPDGSGRLGALVGYLVSAPFSFLINMLLTNGLQVSLTWHELMSLYFITEGLFAAFLASTFMFTGVILGRRICAAYAASSLLSGLKYASFIERMAAFGIDFIATAILWMLFFFHIKSGRKIKINVPEALRASGTRRVALCSR